MTYMSKYSMDVVLLSTFQKHSHMISYNKLLTLIQKCYKSGTTYKEDI